MLSRSSKLGGTLTALTLALLATVPAWADPVSVPAADAETAHWFSTQAIALFSAALAIGIGTLGPSLAQGNALARAMESIGRNPESASKVQSVLLIGLAFIESLCIYALVIAFIAVGKVG
ncbi:ATP synthase F0 subunit C [bacterium]|nr:ATP synthase F0 subunit C [bacterium]